MKNILNSSNYLAIELLSCHAVILLVASMILDTYLTFSSFKVNGQYHISWIQLETKATLVLSIKSQTVMRMTLTVDNIILTHRFHLTSFKMPTSVEFVNYYVKFMPCIVYITHCSQHLC